MVLWAGTVSVGRGRKSVFRTDRRYPGSDGLLAVAGSTRRGLTHAFPDRAAVAASSLVALGFPEVEAGAIARLATDGGEDSSYVAFRTGRRDAFPREDPALRAALTNLGLTGPAIAWQPWLALAAAHLMAHGERLARADHRAEGRLAAGAMT